MKAINIKVTTDQYEQLKVAADKIGLMVGPYMRMAALKAAEPETQPAQVNTDG